MIFELLRVRFQNSSDRERVCADRVYGNIEIRNEIGKLNKPESKDRRRLTKPVLDSRFEKEIGERKIESSIRSELLRYSSIGS